MQEELIIIGAGSVGGHVASNLQDYSSHYKCIGFLDDDLSKVETKFVNFPVLGTVEKISDYNLDINIVVGIAFPLMKSKIIEKLKKFGFYNFPSLISNAAWISKNTKIGEGCIVYPGVSINYNTSIGDFVVFNMNCAIGHDCRIGNNISFAPGVLIGGNTHIDDFTEMGIGCRTLQGLSIGENSSVGAGAVIIKDVPEGAVIVGNPGKIIKYNND